MDHPAVAKFLMSVRETAASLGISERTLFSETKAGRIKACRIRARVMYRPEAVDEYAREAEQPRPAAV